MRYIVEVDGARRTIDVLPDAIEIDGRRIEARLAEVPGTPVSLLTIGDRVFRILAHRGEERGNYSLAIDGRRYAAEALDERSRAIRDLSVAAAEAAGPAPLVAPMPGLIVRVHVGVGDEVAAGQGLVVMEAMKMENELRAQRGGRVTAVRVTTGAAVEKGAVLVELE